MQLWEDMVKTALLGTERQAPPLQNADTLLQPLLAQLNPDDRERALLATAGLLTQARRAGYQPTRDNTDLTVADEDTLPLCRPEAASDLASVLDGELADLLPEWLALVAAQGQRVPERWLPALLDRGAKDKDVRSPITAVLDNRGLWLAAQNPAWHYSLQRSFDLGEDTELPADLTEVTWETGLLPERVSYLAFLRRSDSAQARAKLEAVWAQEAYDARAALLTTFKPHLSMADEPFLETVLDDKRKEVREGAQELLRTLPESRLCLRMIERARPLLALAGNRLLGQRLEVTLPATHDKTMARDGIAEKPAAWLKIGEKTFWLQQILAATPLSFWTEHLGQTPQRLVELAAANKDWSKALLEGWTSGLSGQLHTDWAEALLAYWLNPKSGGLTITVPWSKAIPKERLEARVIVGFDFQLLVNHVAQSATLRAVLTECGPIWGNALAERFLDGYRQHSGKKQGDYYLLHSLLEFAKFFPEDKLPALYQLWGKNVGDQDYYRNHLERHIARTQFRQEMRKHITGA